MTKTSQGYITLQLYPLEKRRMAVKNPTKGSLDDSWLELQHFWSPKLIEALHNGAKLMMEAKSIRSIEQFVRTVKGQNNFWLQNVLLPGS